MSDNYIAASEKFEIVHKMSRRIASVDKYCVISVANKAFEEYFGEIKETLIEVVAPQDKERLMDFIEKYDGTAKNRIFVNNSERLTSGVTDLIIRKLIWRGIYDQLG